MMSSRLFVLFFFFKQKTAYEMRISDWSSGVCSSDLSASSSRGGCGVSGDDDRPSDPADRARPGSCGPPQHDAADPAALARGGGAARDDRDRQRPDGDFAAARAFARGDPRADRDRSEEHTSELQSLMRISYAVF